MSPATIWPTVDPNDDGIRPAGRPDECFYCRQRVGAEHGRECVIVTKRVEMRVLAKLPSGPVTGLWQFDEPHYWSPDSSEFHKNESSWCAANFIVERGSESVTWDTVDAWPELSALEASGNCLCGGLSFEFVRVVDGTPRRKIVNVGGAS